MNDTLPVMYDLVANAGIGEPLTSPHCLKARLSLLHKGVLFKTRETTFSELRVELKEKMGKRATLPVLEFADGTRLQDSLEIAHWLEEKYPDEPSIFLPDAPVPVDRSSSEYKAAVAAAVGLSEKFGNIKNGFPPFLGLCLPYFRNHLSTVSVGGLLSDAEYFATDEKLGFPNAWPQLMRVVGDQERLISDAKICIQQLEEMLRTRNFLQSVSSASFADFGVLGRYSSLHGPRPELADELFLHGKVGEWVQRMTRIYQLEGFFARRYKAPASVVEFGPRL